MRRPRFAVLVASAALAGSALVMVNGGSAPVAAGAAGPAPDQVVFVAGDVARGPLGSAAAAGTAATGQLLQSELAQNPGAHVLMLGDGAYPSGLLNPDYQSYYGGTGWGSPASGVNAISVTLPVPGNHDYGQNEAKGTCTPGTAGCDTSGFRTFFASTLNPLISASSPAGNTEASGWWSTTLGAWHIIGLNWSCEKDSTGCGAAARQGTWLSNDLAKNPTACTLAMWHGAPFFSANGSDVEAARGPSVDPKTDAYWEILRKAGADVVLAGHQHQYERFDHMSAVDPPGAPKGAGQVDATGPREFVVGTGGGDPGIFEPSGTAPGTPPPAGGWDSSKIQAVGSQLAIAGNFGILKMVLHDGSYDWSFISAGAGNPNGAGVAKGWPLQPTMIAPAGTVLDSGRDTCFHASGTATTGTTTAGTPPTTSPTTATTTGGSVTAGRRGYWMVGTDGRVYPFGDARHYGDAVPTPGTKIVSLEATPSGDGYWIVDAAGKVSAFGDAASLGAPDPSALRPGEHVASLSPTPTGRGYWIFTDQGRVFPDGDAAFFGDMSQTKLNGPVLGSIPTPSGRGYYMVASDGGIFAFGDAVFRGSMGAMHLNAPVQSLVPTPDNHGYWLVASDGGIFAFDAPFKGSMGSTQLARPVVGMVSFADGYLMVGADGGIFDFSSAPFLGSLGTHPPAQPIVSVAALET